MAKMNSKGFRKSYTILFLLFTNGVLFSQKINDKPNYFYLELGGNSYFYSFNLEKEVFSNITPRIGLSFLAGTENSNSGKHVFFQLNTLLMLNYLLKINQSHMIEFGLGICNILFPRDSYYTGTLGYRYAPANEKYFLKIAYTPFLNNEWSRENHWFGLSVGFWN